ncbi:MAG: DMT family transporter [Ignavibacteriales bacterium]|nr:DMT family transporter [Ignavibacteriales bacterium]
MAICLIWGSTWLVIKVGMESLTVFYSAGFRFVLASILIYGIMKIKKMSLDLSPVAMRIYLYAGFFSFLVPFGLVYWGEQYVNSGMASVLFAVYPFCVAIVAYYRLSEEILNKTKLIGMIIGFGGILVIFFRQFGNQV